MSSSHQIELEGIESAEEVLKHYDRKNDRWHLPETGPFWEAVHQAHEAGFKGAGKTVAIIDGGCDFSFPRIKKQAGDRPRFSVSPGNFTAHGTVVALFVGRVAPECSLDIYEITRDNVPDRIAVQHAIAMAAESGATVINLSLGQPRENKQIKAEPCELCLAAANAQKRGKLIFAATGNSAEQVYCPASNEQCFAVGYRSEKRWLEFGLEGAYELAQWDSPDYSQAFNWSFFTIQQEPGVAGSSFATPLMSGFSTLWNNSEKLTAYQEVSGYLLGATYAAAGAKCFEQALKNKAETAFNEAFDHLPHRHNGKEKGFPCVPCSFFAHDLYINAGLHHLFSGQLDRAEPLLRTAHWLAPKVHQTSANLGRLVEERALRKLREGESGEQVISLLEEAFALYNSALQLRPGFEPYLAEQAKIIEILKKIT